ncbi:MAG: hypothetical protein FJX75_01600 [Armatimonadetes bacterium]|nr:hypothetical protein [Armatimonadota bacterium]
MGRRWLPIAGAVGAIIALSCIAHCVPKHGASRPAEAQAAAESSPVTITGEVLDPEGHPAAGCEVLVFSHGPREVPRLNAVATDPHGSFATTVGVRNPLEPVGVLAELRAGSPEGATALPHPCRLALVPLVAGAGGSPQRMWRVAHPSRPGFGRNARARW